ADVLIPVNGGKDITGVKRLDVWAWDKRVPYEPGADKGLGTRAFYGLKFQGKQRVCNSTKLRTESGALLILTAQHWQILYSVYICKGMLIIAHTTAVAWDTAIHPPITSRAKNIFTLSFVDQPQENLEPNGGSK
ncbi:MAG TPA: hypothetical protein VFM05_12590, partial [Candidatus Saccharimonadales bacterium]|nr:hypothetical protein [Candidatus Saccharimonadales bacterium]